MDLDDRIAIATPEGVELALQLAGLGSRFIAGTVDLVIQGCLTLVLGLLTGVFSGEGAATAVFIVGAFVIWVFYPILFEVLARGQTPAKRWSHLRVVRDTGAPVDLPASAIRNLMRFLDGLPLLYLPSVISIAVSARNQRPGDIAAGTLVIRESLPVRSPPAQAGDAARSDASDWDVSAITPGELVAVRRFLERRETLDRAARHQLALRLAQGLRAKVAGAPAHLDAERFLEQLAKVKGSRR